MRKMILALACALGLATASFGQSGDFYAGVLYDVDSTTLTYCITSGPMMPQQLIKTTGSSANLAPYVASSAPFRGMAVGDVLSIRTAPSTYAWRVVTTFTSENAVTVDTAIDLSATGGFAFQWYRNACGTAATSGWFSVAAAANRAGMTVSFLQGDITNLVARWECKQAGGEIVIVYPGETSDCGLGASLSTDRCSWAAAKAGAADGSLTVVDDAPVYNVCRVGLAYVTADTSDATTNLEKVSVIVTVR
jgi:hypothetical protein